MESNKMYTVDIRSHMHKLFSKLSKRNPRQLEIIRNKVNEIIGNPNRYKNLRSPLEKWKAVHIDKHFVLTFSVDEKTKTVTLEDYDHHNRIYGK